MAVRQCREKCRENSKHLITHKMPRQPKKSKPLDIQHGRVSQYDFMTVSYYSLSARIQNHRMVGVGRDLCGSSSPLSESLCYSQHSFWKIAHFIKFPISHCFYF